MSLQICITCRAIIAIFIIPQKIAKPKQPVATKAQIEALYKKGVSQYIAEKYDAALKTFKQVLALNPNHAGAKDYRKRTAARIKVLKGGG